MSQVYLPYRRLPVFKIPQNLIIFSTASSTPSGWSNVSSTFNNTYVAGAANDSTYNPDWSGGILGSNSVTYPASTYTNYEGTGHAASVDGPSYADYNSGGTGGIGIYNNNSIGGDHRHTLIDVSSYDHPYMIYKIFRATSADMKKFPQDTIFIGDSSFSPTSNMIEDYPGSSGRLIRVHATSTGTGGSNNVSINTEDYGLQARSHHHGGTTAPDVRPGGTSYLDITSSATSAHDDPIDGVLTPAVKRKLFAAWKTVNANQKIIPGMIALYYTENNYTNTVAPDGWAKCDGTGGTSDLRQYFIEICQSTDPNIGNTYGNNTVDTSINASHDYVHTHKDKSVYGDYIITGTYTTNHGVYTWTHSHTGSVTGTSYTPQYKAFLFIQKL